MFKRVTVLAALVLFAFASAANAQEQGTIEIGFDNAFSLHLVQDLKFNDVVVEESRSDFDFMVPGIYWRFGYFASPQISIEPVLGFLLSSTGNDGGTDYLFNIGLNVLYNLPSGMYAGVNGVLLYLSEDPGGEENSITGTQFGFGGQVGYRTRFLADNIRFRVGLVYNYLLESENLDDPEKFSFAAEHRFMVPFGISIMVP